MAMRDVIVYLEDIRIFIEDLHIINREAGTFNNYVNNSLYVNASEMILIKIGEAMTNILRIEPNIEITDARKIKGLRNIIAHQYCEVDYDKIWNVILHDIPLLEAEIKTQIQTRLKDFPKK